jgi:hypothetical protein
MNDSLIRDYCTALGLTKNYERHQDQDDEQMSKE